MGARARADPRAAVAQCRVGLGVAGDARGEISLCLERVVARLARRIAPDALRGVKSRGAMRAPGAALADAKSLVAGYAEALLPVAAGASLGLHQGLDRVQVQVVGRMNRAHPNPSVVAVGAEVFFVAIGAKLRVRAGRTLVALHKIRAVLGVVEPRWRGWQWEGRGPSLASTKLWDSILHRFREENCNPFTLYKMLSQRILIRSVNENRI